MNKTTKIYYIQLKTRCLNAMLARLSTKLRLGGLPI